MPDQENPYHPVITIIEEDDINDELSGVERRLRNFRQSQQIPLIDLTQDEEQQRDLLQYELQIINELDGNGRRRPNAPLRNALIPQRLQLSSVRHGQMLIEQGTCVEVLPRGQDEYCWQFLHVHAIYRDSQSHSFILRGIRLTRHRHARGLLPRFKNEVCALYDMDENDMRLENIQAAVEISATEVIKTRALLRTNDAFPSHRFDRTHWASIQDIEEKAVLVQRWKWLRYWPTTEARVNNKKSYRGAVIGLRSGEIEDPRLRVPDDKLRNSFRGGIVRGGSFKDGQHSIPTVNLDDVEQDATVAPGQKYTAVDFCCGAGGASCGFQRGGFQLGLACDMDQAACRSYRENFPEADLKEMDIFRLIEEFRPWIGHFDTVHWSPPCQTFSPAHTRAGKNDEANIAVLYIIGSSLEATRPRISTGEQTFGLLFDRNEEFFNALVGQYTALGFSFSWDILRFKDYGLPTIRRRLIWIASCPGEKLPPFPSPTHAAETGGELPPPVTLHDVLNRIQSSRRHRDPLHDVELMLYKAKNSVRFPRAPYDARCQVGTITTAGSEWAHPSGQRNFTLRELASIQGFPRSHKFVGTMTQINRQIGNAFPPVVVETLYRHLRKWLLLQDGIVDRNVIILDPVEDAARISQPARAPIIIEDDNDDVVVVEYYNQEAPAGRNKHNTNVEVNDSIIMIEDSEDEDMIDLTGFDANVEDYPSFSRESSRTLSTESLPLLLMEVDD